MHNFTAIAGREPLRLQPALTDRHKRTESYQPPVGLPEAADIAMLLGVPLLLTGEPGAGKTRAAYWLNAQLGLGIEQLLRFDVKSTSSGTDLLYQFDEVARFRDASDGRERPLVEYLRLNALGAGIVLAAGGNSVLISTSSARRLDGEQAVIEAQLLDRAFGARWRSRGRAEASLLLADGSIADTPGETRVVLIDELDKSPRDTPNDLLVEVEEMEFSIPELGIKVKAEGAARPVVIITSNSEKSLPEPFLRRCAFFDIAEPGEKELRKIIDASLEQLSGGGQLVDDALHLYRVFRSDTHIRRKPGTAELLAWLDTLVAHLGLAKEHGLARPPVGQHAHADTRDELEARILRTFGTLFKSRDDLEAAKAAYVAWSRTSEAMALNG